jgi:hypothetical protein
MKGAVGAVECGPSIDGLPLCSWPARRRCTRSADRAGADSTLRTVRREQARGGKAAALRGGPHSKAGLQPGKRVVRLLAEFSYTLQERGPGVSTFSWLGEKPQRDPSVARPGHPSVAGSGERRADGPRGPSVARPGHRRADEYLWACTYPLARQRAGLVRRVGRGTHRAMGATLP